MRMLFLSAANPCLSVMAAAILQSINQTISICVADIFPETIMHPNAVKVMTDSGLSVGNLSVTPIEQIKDIDFDYIITVGDGTAEDVPNELIAGKRKLHLGFRNPFSGYAGDEAAHQQYSELKEEMTIELDYFNRHYIESVRSVS